MMAENRDKFFEDLVNYYKSTVLGTAESVDILAKIEEVYPEHYQQLKQASIDPQNIEDILSDLTDEEKEAFFIIFAKANFIMKKLNNLFDLSIEEKKKLSKSIRDLADFTGKKIIEAKEKMKEEPKTSEEKKE